MVTKKKIFPQSEYARRIRRTKEAMDRQGMELLLVTDPANMNYLTGYDGWSFYVHQGVVLSLASDEPLWFGRQQDANGARLTTWLPEACIFGYPDEYVQSRYTHTMRYVAQLLREQDLAEKRLGLEMDAYWFSARMYLTLQEELPRATLMDANNLVNWVKSVKSEQEIAYMRQAARICEKVMQTGIDAIAPGVWEKDAAARVSAAQIAGMLGMQPWRFTIINVLSAIAWR